jgi:hypothetical protein
MATKFSNTLHPSWSPVANFRAFAQFVEDLLVTTGGWTVTADTGQTLPSALLIPTAQNVKMGFRIYQMTDALSATYPVVMKVDYGSSQFNGSMVKIWVTVGMGSDGIGNITNVMVNSLGCAVGTNASSATDLTNSYGSASPGRMCFGLFVSESASLNYQLIFSIERSKNDIGADNGDGILITLTNGLNSGVDSTQYGIYANTLQPAQETGVAYIMTMQNPSQSFDGSVGAGVISHFKGIAQQPGIGMIIMNSADVPPEGTFVLNIYGANHAYQHLGANTSVTRPKASGTFYTDFGARPCIRFD